jgi:hypothetical protein
MSDEDGKKKKDEKHTNEAQKHPSDTDEDKGEGLEVNGPTQDDPLILVQVVLIANTMKVLDGHLNFAFALPST